LVLKRDEQKSEPWVVRKRIKWKDEWGAKPESGVNGGSILINWEGVDNKKKPGEGEKDPQGKKVVRKKKEVRLKFRRRAQL